MTTSAAQDEFNELVRDKDRDTQHPEDRNNNSDVSDAESEGAADDYKEIIDTDDELDIPSNMRSNYYLPSLRSEANTGPKGVIADARAFEEAKKQARRFTWKKNASPTPDYSVRVWHDDKASSDEENEDGFMKEWRAARLRELQNVGEKIRSRTNSPSRRIYGGFPLVDPVGYLDAVEKSHPDTMVVVYVFDDSLKNPHPAENHMREVAKRNDTVRFVRLSRSDAEFTSELPAILAYKGGVLFANIIPDELPIDSELTAVSLETRLRQDRIL